MKYIIYISIKNGYYKIKIIAIGSDYMKIEKLSDNQIRCTLTKADLASRQLKISELAYGSEKAKELFRDMMQQASYELGFEADDIPLMIEAIPVSSECIILIVTKVDDPEELDTRFSKFSPSDIDDFDTMEDLYTDQLENIETIESDNDSDLSDTNDDNILTDDVMDLFSKVKNYLNNSINKKNDSDKKDSIDKADNFVPLHESLKKDNTKSTKSSNESDNPLSSDKIIRTFIFNKLDTVCDAAAIIASIYNDKSSLYKDKRTSTYYLILEKVTCPAVNFNKACNILSEYSDKEISVNNRINFFDEHFECLVRDRAVYVMSKM